MKCAICGDSPMDGATLYRQNEKGPPGIWLCERHAKYGKPPNLEVAEIIRAIKEPTP